MKNPLNKRLPREIEYNLGRYLAVFLMMTTVIALVSGFLVAAESAKRIYKDNFEKSKIEDGGFITAHPLDAAALNGIEKLGIRVYEDCYRNDIMFDVLTFGVAVVKNSVFQTFPEKELVNHYSFHFQEESLPQKERNKIFDKIIAELSKTNAVLDFSLAENNQAISFVGDDMGSDIPMMKTLLYIIIVIMGFVFGVIIGNTIEGEAPIIGTLLASGYNRHELICHYMAPALIISVFSGLCGNLLGYTAMVGFMKNMYYESYSLSPYHTFWNGNAFLDTTVIPVILLVLINYLFLLKKMSLTPLQFLRKELRGRKGKRAVKLPGFSFPNRFRLRIIFQNKSNYLVLFVGIFFASFILMWGLCITTTIDKYEKEVVNSAKSSYQYILKAPVEYTKESSRTAAAGNQNTAALPEKEPEKFTVTSMESYYKLAGKNIEVSVYGIKENSSYFQGLPVKENTKGVYLSENLLKKLGKKTGDTISLYDKLKDKTYKEKIRGTYEYAGALSVFLAREELNGLIGKGSAYFNGYFSDEELKLPKEATASVITMEDMLKLGRQIDKSMGPMQYVIFLMSVIIFLVLMYILTKVVIEKNAISISFMKVFGYEDREINRIYLNSITYTVLASLIVTLPLDVFCMSQIIKLIFIKMDGYFEFYIKPYQYGEIVLIGMATYFAVNALHRKRIRKIKMADALKMRE